MAKAKVLRLESAGRPRVTFWSNFPQLPEDLRRRLESVLLEINDYILDTGKIPEAGSILAGEDGVRYLLNEIGIESMELLVTVRGSFQRLLKNGGLGKSGGPVFDRPGMSRDGDPQDWSGEVVRSYDDVYRVLGKYVDYDR